MSTKPESVMVTVCDHCLMASCWQGIFYCEKYKTAGTCQRSVKDLMTLAREHPCYWEAGK